MLFRSYRNESNIAEKIVHFHDHKGTLFVSWDSEPTVYFKDVVELAWKDCGYEELVEHTLAAAGRCCVDLPDDWTTK